MEHHDPAESSAKEYIKFAAIIAAIVIVTQAIFVMSESGSTSEWMRIFMGVFMVVFASFKLAGYQMFVAMFPMYDLLAKRVSLYAKLFPFIELSLGALFLFDAFETARLATTVLVMGIGTLSIIKTVYFQKRKIHCACLGNIIKLPLSTVSLAEDSLMFVMAAWMLFA